MVLTPSSTSSALAGMGFWGLVWATIAKVDTLPVINKFVSKEKIFSWVGKNKGTTLLLTELTNFTIHGVENPNAVTMAVGGTVVNAAIVYGILPFRQWRMDKRFTKPILEGL